MKGNCINQKPSIFLEIYNAIYDATAIVRSAPSEKTWESLFQTLVKAFRLQEAEETILAFDNYSDNQEFSLK